MYVYTLVEWDREKKATVMSSRVLDQIQRINKGIWKREREREREHTHTGDEAGAEIEKKRVL